MSYLIHLLKIIFKPINVSMIALIIIIGLPLTIYLINPYKINSDNIRSRIFGVDIYRIPSGSMKPGLVPGDYILVSNTAYQEAKPKRKDVIVFNANTNKDTDKKISYIKRIVAIPGDTIKIENGKVVVNAQILFEPYVLEKNNRSQYSQSMNEKTVPADMLFVIGDNRDNSNDSRLIGAISTDEVVGKATDIIFAANGRDRGEIK